MQRGLRSARKKPSPALILLILLVLLGGSVYWNKDNIIKYAHIPNIHIPNIKMPSIPKFTKKTTVPAKPVQSPPPAQTKPAENTKAKSVDITEILHLAGALIPSKVWYTRLAISCDGSYDIQGIAFSRDAIVAFSDSLKKTGTVDTMFIPELANNPATIYKFAFKGKFAGIKAPDILDPFPPEKLTAITDSLKIAGSSLGVAFLKSPTQGLVIKDTDNPFEVSGSYDAVENLISTMNVSGTGTVISRLIIEPATKGKPSDKVKAMFAVRMVSSL